MNRHVLETMATNGGTYVRRTVSICNRKTPGLPVTVGQRSKPRLLGQKLFACEPSRAAFCQTLSPSTDPQEPRERLNILHMGPPHGAIQRRSTRLGWAAWRSRCTSPRGQSYGLTRPPCSGWSAGGRRWRWRRRRSPSGDCERSTRSPWGEDGEMMCRQLLATPRGCVRTVALYLKLGRGPSGASADP